VDAPDQHPRCRGELSHLWNGDIGAQPRVVESDWCVNCGIPRPGYIDPAEKWKDSS
jgi:hypothetical protein